MNRDRLLADAKAKALALVEDYAPPEAAKSMRLPGATGAPRCMAVEQQVRRWARRRRTTWWSADALADMLTGGDVDYTDEIDRGRGARSWNARHFMRLVRHPDTLARVEHMLETGKPLRN